MARRRKAEEHENHERWLVSYADFITLLFAFFVVMYSISSINEGKYKQISQALIGVFNDPERSMKPIPIGDERPLSVKPAEPLIKDSEQTDAGLAQTSVDPLKTITDDVRDAFGDLIKSNQMTVRGNELWVEIELNSALLFGSGDAMPSDVAFEIIEKVAKILAVRQPSARRGLHRQPADPYRAVPDQLGAVVGAGGEYRSPAGDGRGQPGAHGLGGLRRIPAGGWQRHGRRPRAQSSRGAGDLAQPRSAPQPDWQRQCQCHPRCRHAPGWHTKCTCHASTVDRGLNPSKPRH